MQADLIHAKAIELSKLALQMTAQAAAGHPSSATSLAHIVATLMYGEMRYDPKNPWNRGADRLVLSEGHAVPIVYAAYADLAGAIGNDPAKPRQLSIDDLNDLREWDSVLDGHPNPAEGFPFFDAATGSLGMGLSVAAGLAIAARLDGLDRNVYCLIGDGESREGQIAEALDFIVDHGLSNICAFFNCNGKGQAAAVSTQQSPQTLYDKLIAFRWEAAIIDGHDPNQIAAAIDSFRKSDRPFAIVAKTVKGWGVQRLQQGNSHGKPLTKGQVQQALESLDAKRTELGVQAVDASVLRPPAVMSEPRPGRQENFKLPPFAEGLQAAGFGEALDKGKLATRRAYGAALAALGALDDRIVALDGDVSNSTFAEIFAVQHPERFFEGKIAEQNMVSAAVGLAAAGKIPFVSSFAKFITRASDQVELAAISRANIKIVGSHCGLGPASDGPSQMALADVAFFRALADVDGGGQPACRFFQPADAVAAYKMTELMANLTGMCYMRTHRPDVSFIYRFDEAFEVGGSKLIRQGPVITLVASGFMVSVATAACGTLAEGGLDCTLIDAYGMPLNTELILEAAGQTNSLILTVEDNYGGGFGSAVAEAAAKAGGFTVEQLCLRRIPKSARRPEELLAHYGLSSDSICGAVRRLTKS